MSWSKKNVVLYGGRIVPFRLVTGEFDFGALTKGAVAGRIMFACRRPSRSRAEATAKQERRTERPQRRRKSAIVSWSSNLMGAYWALYLVQRDW